MDRRGPQVEAVGIDRAKILARLKAAQTADAMAGEVEHDRVLRLGVAGQLFQCQADTRPGRLVFQQKSDVGRRKAGSGRAGEELSQGGRVTYCRGELREVSIASHADDQGVAALGTPAGSSLRLAGRLSGKCRTNPLRDYRRRICPGRSGKFGNLPDIFAHRGAGRLARRLLHQVSVHFDTSAGIEACFTDLTPKAAFCVRLQRVQIIRAQLQHDGRQRALGFVDAEQPRKRVRIHIQHVGRGVDTDRNVDQAMQMGVQCVD